MKKNQLIREIIYFLKKIKNLKDKSVSNSLWFIYIMKSIETSAINWDIIIKDKKDDENKENNVKYFISIARK